MTLEFTKNQNVWSAEFKAESDFNLHIEGVKEGDVEIYQRGTESGAYSHVRGATPYPSFSNVYDFDFAGVVYPKYIKVECPVEPTMAIVTYNA